MMDFGLGGFPVLMSFVSGDIFGDSYEFSLLKLANLYLPSSITQKLKGPRFGVEGIRKLLKIDHCKRPLLGLLLKPNLGCPPEYYANLVSRAAEAGVDFIKEDELLTNPTHCPILKRVECISGKLQKHSDRTGENILYAPNVTCRTRHIHSLVKKVISLGANAIMINALQTGLDTLASIAEDSNISVPIHVHRAGFDILSSGNKAVLMNAIAKLLRLAGADSVHIGPIFGGLFSKNEVALNHEMLREPNHHFKECLPFVSRSCVDIMESTVSFLRTPNVMFLFDAAVYRHDQGVLKALKIAKKEAERIGDRFEEAI